MTHFLKCNEFFFSVEMMWKHVLPCVRLATRLGLTLLLSAGEYSQYRRLSRNREILSKSGDNIHKFCLIGEIVS